MEDTTASSAPGTYRGQAGLTGTEDTAGGEHRLVKLGRRYGHGGHGIVSTISLNRDDIAAAEENCEHHLVKPGRNRWRIVSTVLLNRDAGMGTEDTG